MSVGLEHYLGLSAILFGIGLWIALAKRNAIVILMGIELMLSSVNLMLIAFSRFVESDRPIAGHVFVIFILAVAAAEASVGLELAVTVYRNRRTVDIDRLNLLKW
ncbi:MAG: NADH-quinone oxidoreductase subunit NuoK [Dehalococcoidia bacterium]